MFLANENIPFPSIRILREHGIFIKSIAENSPGISDADVIAFARNEELIIITQDSDYGELIFKYGIDFTSGVIYFRNTFKTPFELGEILLEMINQNIDFKSKFTTVDNNQIRQRNL